MGIPVGMGWVWGLKCHPHGSPAKKPTGSNVLINKCRLIIIILSILTELKTVEKDYSGDKIIVKCKKNESGIMNDRPSSVSSESSLLSELSDDSELLSQTKALTLTSGPTTNRYASHNSMTYSGFIVNDVAPSKQPKSSCV